MDDPITKRKVPLTDDIARMVKANQKTESAKQEPSSTFKVPDTRFDDEVRVLEGNSASIR